MSIEELRAAIPDYAKDIRLNLGSILGPNGATDITEKQKSFILLACTYATKSAELINSVYLEVSQTLNATELDAVRSAAVIMAMNNVYYRFTHLVSDKAYQSMPANLRMNILANPGIDKVDFELMSLAVSAINGCGLCIDAHVNTLIKAGLSRSAIQSTVRIASVIHAVSLVGYTELKNSFVL